jgi:hypothetical protein
LFLSEYFDRMLSGKSILLFFISDSQLVFSSALFLSGPLLPPPPRGDVINGRPLGLEPGDLCLGLGLVTFGLGLTGLAWPCDLRPWPWPCDLWPWPWPCDLWKPLALALDLAL